LVLFIFIINAHDIPEDTHEGTPKPIPEDTPKPIPEDTPKHIPEDKDMPEECKEGNYKELIGKNHEHRYLGFRTSSERLTRKIHERAENYTVGFDNWFRFNTDNAKRMLEVTELPKLIEDKDAVSDE